MTVDYVRWGADERALLREARRVHGHTQAQCIDWLHSQGAAAVAQSTFANWESGKTHRPPDLAIGAIALYCDGVVAPDSVERGAAAGSPDDEFEAMVAELTGARPLTDRQARALDGLMARLTSGPPMSESDLAMARIVLGLSGLETES